jgi:hypothetical protein
LENAISVPNCTDSALCFLRLFRADETQIEASFWAPSALRRSRSRFRYRNAPNKPTQNIVAKKIANQAGVNLDYPSIVSASMSQNWKHAFKKVAAVIPEKDGIFARVIKWLPVFSCVLSNGARNIGADIRAQPFQFCSDLLGDILHLDPSFAGFESFNTHSERSSSIFNGIL